MKKKGSFKEPLSVSGAQFVSFMTADKTLNQEVRLLQPGAAEFLKFLIDILIKKRKI